MGIKMERLVKRSVINVNKMTSGFSVKAVDNGRVTNNSNQIDYSAMIIVSAILSDSRYLSKYKATGCRWKAPLNLVSWPKR